MKTKHNLAALFIISACAVSFSANAQENSVERIVSNLVSTAVESVSEELNKQIEDFSIDTKEWFAENKALLATQNQGNKQLTVSNKTENKDLPAEKLSENVNQNEKAND